MRNLIVKLFAFDYIVKTGKRSGNFLRAANIIFPLCALTITLLAASEDWNVPIYLSIISEVALAISLFIGFVYFNYYPVKFDELDISQKWQYGKSGYAELSPNELGEWNAIDREKESLVYSPLWVLFVNIIVFVLFITYMFI